MKKVSEKNIYRLILYKRILEKLKLENRSKLYSYELARLSDSTSTQVRRDLMVVGYNGSPAHGYNVNDLYESISAFVDPKSNLNLILIGVGNLGRAILDYIPKHNPKLTVLGVFDIDPEKIGRVIHSYRSYHISQLEQFIASNNIELAMITTPSEAAQNITDVLSNTNIKGIINFSPAQLQLHNKNIFVENMDMMVSLQKVAHIVSQQ
jgi:redox-sensing transcriptional repressor